MVEPERKTEISLECDVLVAGGGVAGIAAALAAARGGKDVLLIEREYMVGGMATLGLIAIFLPLCDGMGSQVVFGIGEELFRLSVRHGAEGELPRAWLEGGSTEERKKARFAAQFNPHMFALEAERLLLEHGVRIMYGTLACGATVEDGRITAVVVENKSGRSAIAADCVIDCTGDADICHLAGARTALYRGGNGLASWYYYYSGGKVALKMFGLADVVPNRAGEGGGEAEGISKVESLDEDFRFSGVDGEELSRAVIAAHGKMYEDILAKREKDPSYVPVAVSAIPLVRMSRRLVGESALDISDDHRHMPDSVGMTGDWRARGPVYEIPFGALRCREVKNLLAAGRAISVTDEMWDITRVIPPCAVTGEAAGTAASLGSDFARLDVKELQRRLERQSVRLHFQGPA